jgi:PhzF family phenazine biosynthesis protein
VRDLRRTGERLTLEMKAGVIPVTVRGDMFTLQAATPSHRRVDAVPEELAALLGLEVRDLGDSPLWVSTGTEQLLVPLRAADAVRRVRVDAQRAEAFKNALRAVMIYVWAEDAPGRAVARFIFSRSPGMLGEDPGTGSACANLGGWILATGRTLPVTLTIHQGDHLGRACRLYLDVDREGRIFVGGKVIEIGRGHLHQ